MFTKLNNPDRWNSTAGAKIAIKWPVRPFHKRAERSSDAEAKRMGFVGWV